MRFNTVFTILFIISEPAFAKDDLKETCLPIQANIHEPLRCREEGTGEFKYDNDCCAGSNKSPSPGVCANGFNKTEGKVCGQENDWCRTHECRKYTCQQSTSCLKYVGCFNDNVDAREFQFKAKLETPAWIDEKIRLLNNVGACLNHCREEKFSFAAIQGAKMCFCGDTYGKYGNADERLCGKKEGKAVALRCGDNNEHTCDGVNAVYSVAGKQPCCDYYQVPEHHPDLRWIFWVIVGPGIALAFIICFVGLPGCIGLCIVMINKRKKKKRDYQRSMAAAGTANVVVAEPATVAAVSVTVVDPATQKTGAVAVAAVAPASVVAAATVAPASVVVASPQHANIYPTM